jgi:type IV pilus assembly protein PilC
MVRSPLSLLGLGVFVITLYVAVKLLFPRFWLCVPVFGHIGRCLYTARMLRQMANQVARNVPLPEALEQCGKTMRNSAYRSDCRSAAAAARKGMSFAEIVLRYYWLFHAWLSPMIAVENVRESLSKSLRRAAETVEQQKDVSILLLQTMSLPLFIMIMFCAISFFVMAMFMPLVKLITDLSCC